MLANGALRCGSLVTAEGEGLGIDVLRRAKDAPSMVALTFDDCNQEHAWTSVVDALAGEGARASFFPCGMRVEEFPEAARATLSAGHSVGSHGWDHSVLRGKAASDVRDNLRQDLAAWERVAGLTSLSFFRPPYGAYDAVVLEAAERLGFSHMVLWDVDPRDWTRPGRWEIEQRVVGEAQPGSIIVMHAIDETAEAIPAIVDGLRCKGLEPVPLSALSNRADEQKKRRP